MSFNIFNNLFDLELITDEDVIIYYYTNFSKQVKPDIKLASTLTSLDAISTLIQAKYIDESEIKQDLINYYKTELKPNAKLIKQTLSKLEKSICLEQSKTTQPELNSQHNTYSIINDNKLIKFDERDLVNGEYIVPTTITIIGDNAFKGCKNLKVIHLHNNIQELGDATFSLCTNLQQINLPNSLTYIGVGCFLACHNLSSIIVPIKVTEILPLTFASCKKLSSITLPKKLKSISFDAFISCDNLTDVTVPESFKQDWQNGKFKTINRGSRPILKTILNSK